jgi:hypothetical protein
LGVGVEAELGPLQREQMTRRVGVTTVTTSTTTTVPSIATVVAVIALVIIATTTVPTVMCAEALGAPTKRTG